MGAVAEGVEQVRGSETPLLPRPSGQEGLREEKKKVSSAFILFYY